ncbi:DUF488 family protein [Myroides odoratus]|uniref:DUF488 domain-containing protein n=1 Tax=Myroides odoratus TaxID=256 RepID=UPI00333F6DC8
MIPQLKIKRIYEEPSASDGYRVLVDRLWPRGISKENAAIEEWAKDITPTTEIRKAYGHIVEHWQTFTYQYLQELKHNELIPTYLEKWEDYPVITFVYAARDTEHTHALILQDYMQKLFNQRFDV